MNICASCGCPIQDFRAVCESCYQRERERLALSLEVAYV